VRVRVDKESERIVFELVEYVKKPGMGLCFGDVLSTHSLSLGATSEDRAVAHYEGFCENYGFGIKEGDRVYMPSASATSGYRWVKVTKVTGRRLHFRGKYLHGGDFESVGKKGEARLLGSIVAKRRKVAA
jgi:hypothetical protein